MLETQYHGCEGCRFFSKGLKMDANQECAHWEYINGRILPKENRPNWCPGYEDFIDILKMPEIQCPGLAMLEEKRRAKDKARTMAIIVKVLDEEWDNPTFSLDKMKHMLFLMDMASHRETGSHLTGFKYARTMNDLDAVVVHESEVD